MTPQVFSGERSHQKGRRWQRWVWSLKTAGCCVCRVEAYQTVLQLMGEKELYDYYVDQKRVSGTTWTLDAARTVLHTWQRKFSAVSPVLGVGGCGGVGEGGGPWRPQRNVRSIGGCPLTCRVSVSR